MGGLPIYIILKLDFIQYKKNKVEHELYYNNLIKSDYYKHTKDRYEHSFFLTSNDQRSIWY